uniref:NADH-ubiquinone oxidoreductase chain 4 n=1 Tax=Phyllodiaptomus tunguidus TaxID=2690417 RepID=A0A6G6YC71_9MAXI|nr:NADH dehydrogenase subunit 4 [Phyllodiaptomus tunguidus]QIG86768.1 NADH dehydrogenase subunit 4 [Phyllodiaptomus tunguidus]UDF84408.1 NADH dehydrogenase subunit 4 [Phyllodiaptomus tunguidus]UDF84421.1 NADH dehydrogenase subunit 4 [Phyllodiaptomus tunguidus]
MMKLIFLAMMTPTTPPLFLSFIIIYIIFISMKLPLMNFSTFPEMEFLSFTLVILSAWLLLLMANANYLSKNKNAFFFMMKLLFVSLAASFFSGTTLLFYFFFEVALIPIFWIILGWGYQPERFLASMMMFFYTMLSSLPLLISLIFIWSEVCSISVFSGFYLFNSSSLWVNLTLMAAFLVKFPMYLVHLWLPKAHVEAPVAGSMILAGVLLKLGGYGLYRLSFLIVMSFLNKFTATLSLFGAVTLACVCCRLTDMKVMIAYSSVVHMALIILALMSLESMSTGGIWWVMLAHGLVSSGLFACANIFYEATHSRSMLLNKGFLSFSPALTTAWFLLLMMNFGGPFTLNLYGEVNLILTTFSFSSYFLILVFFLTFFSAAYSLILYSSTQQGLKPGGMMWFNLSSNRELSLLWAHIWPVFLLLADLNL